MNKFRNEVKLELNGNSYLLRGTFGALVEIEDEVGEPLPVLLNNIAQGNVSLRTIMSVILYGARAANPDLDEDRLEQDIAEGGINTAITGIVEFLVVALEGGKQVKKKK